MCVGFELYIISSYFIDFENLYSYEGYLLVNLRVVW